VSHWCPAYIYILAVFGFEQGPEFKTQYHKQKNSTFQLLPIIWIIASTAVFRVTGVFSSGVIYCSFFLCMLGKCSTTELHPQPSYGVIYKRRN
jgi:hypothetical protein